MSGLEPFGYGGRRALVVGGATGMGAAAAKVVTALGGEVVVWDQAPVDYPAAAATEVDLRDRSAIDRALDSLDGPIDALFSAAGVADGASGVMRVNFISHRHVIDRLISSGHLARGSAICMISSVAGLGWESNLVALLDFLSTPDDESAASWVREHEGSDSYVFSKQAINCYVARQAYPFLCMGIRINAILPGPTDTPLARANADTWLTFAQDYREATKASQLTAEQMGNAMVFLNSSAASGISGVGLLVDQGHVMSSRTGSWEPGGPLIASVLGRTQ